MIYKKVIRTHLIYAMEDNSRVSGNIYTESDYYSPGGVSISGGGGAYNQIFIMKSRPNSSLFPLPSFPCKNKKWA